MKEYRNLMVRGIKEAVPRTNNIKLAFDCHQGKEESPVDWLNRLKKNFQLYSGLDTESPQGQEVLKIQYVTRSWQDIRKKLEKLEDWQDRGTNDLLKETQKVYLRRDEEKTKIKAKIYMVAAW